MTIITQYHDFSNINSMLYVKIYLGDLMKKTNIFKCFLMTMGLTILTSFILALVYKIVRSWTLAYTIGYLIMIILLGNWFKKDLIDNAKSFRNDFRHNWLNLLIVTTVFIVLLYISNYLVIKYIGRLSFNEIIARNQLYSSPILMGINLVLLAPLIEEIIYRLPYKKVEKHKLLNFFVYSLVFALAHIAITNGAKEFWYLIPYTFLSMSISYSFYKTNNIYMSIIVHILNNFINVVIILFL